MVNNKLKYKIIVFGCQMNINDAERLATILEKMGYQKTEEIKETDLIAIVSCSVRQMAIDRVYGAIKNIRREKRKIKIIVTGCLPPTDKKKLSARADLIIEIKDINKLPKLLKIKNNLPITKDYFNIKPKHSNFPIAYIPIMTGCNNFCSYCVVPYTRGREMSRNVKEIIEETKKVIEDGYKMIILLGQNVNSYQSNKINFPKLLKLISNLPGNFWLTFISSHPKDFSDELIEAMKANKKIMPFLHLPVQSGDNQILKKMNRPYTINHYHHLIHKIRSKIPEITISTDIIVGFCQETKKQFSNSAKLMRQICFDMVYLAKYSPRPGTAAWQLPDNVSAQEKEKRWKILGSILKKTAFQNNKKYLNKIIEVLITSQKGNYLIGQTKSFKNVRINYQSTTINKQQPIVGNIIKTKITKVIPWGLEGIIV